MEPHNSGGDSFFAEFPSAVSAVECASEFQGRLREFYSQNNLPIKLQFRIGIHMGDVIKEKRNLLGDGVNIAARLEALAQPSGVTISKSIFDLVKGKVDLSFTDLGLQKVKENEFHAYDILLSKSQKRTLRTSSKPILRNLGIVASLFAVVIIGIVFYLQSDTKTVTKTQTMPIDKPSILVMPFENQTGNSDNDFIGFGVTSNIIST
ncbi:adenylate/guanylate cyclase domain-containing protein, partial [Paracoccaceae bacterium]|nr:adenylate/guanylate cyclase domain-containing protein [Paracoccaceae bacterium]